MPEMLKFLESVRQWKEIDLDTKALEKQIEEAKKKLMAAKGAESEEIAEEKERRAKQQ